MIKNLSHLFIIRKQTILSAIGLTIGYIAVAMLGIFTGNLVDTMLGVQIDKSVWQKLGLLLLLQLVILCINFFLTVWIPQKLNLEAAVSSSESAVSALLKIPFRIFSKKNIGHYLNAVTTSAFVFSSIQVSVSVELIGSLLALVVLVIVAAIVNPWVGLFVLLYIPFYLFIIDYPSKKANEVLSKSIEKREAWLDAGRRVIEEKLSINALRAESYYEKTYKSVNDEYFLFVKRNNFYSSLSKNLPSALLYFMQVITIILGIILLSFNQMSVGGILSAYLIVSIMSEPLDTFCFVKSTYLATKADIDVCLKHIQDSQEPSGFESLWDSSLDSALQVGEGELLATTEGPELFHTQPLCIAHGSLVVVRGSNGSGKSSFVDLLAGCSDPSLFSGDIQLSDELRDCSRFARPVPLVKGSLSDNMFGEEIDDKIYQMLDFSSLRTEGFDGNAESVSLGERQKIGLLRALSRKQGALVLDEPLQNLDAATAQRLCDYLVSLKGKRTVIVIMHSDELDQKADVLLDIQDGKLFVR